MESDVAQVSYFCSGSRVLFQLRLIKLTFQTSKFESHRHGWITQGPLHSLTSQSQHFREGEKNLMVRPPFNWGAHSSFISPAPLLHRMKLFRWEVNLPSSRRKEGGTWVLLLPRLLLGRMKEKQGVLQRAFWKIPQLKESLERLTEGRVYYREGCTCDLP